MTSKYLLVGLTVAMAASVTQATAESQTLLSPGDPIIAVSHLERNFSEYPNGDGIKSKLYEGPWNITDGNSATKYLNWGMTNTGFILTPYITEAIKGFRITTANDASGRDPSSYELYGTNEQIVTQDNGTGLEEEWELISAGSITLPTARFTEGELVTFENDKVYDSYKMLFPTLRDIAIVISEKSGMQIADIQFYGEDGESPLLPYMDEVLAIQTPVCASGHEPDTKWTGAPKYCIDQNHQTYYANTGIIESGLIVTPGVGFTKLESMILTTATNRVDCDPASFTLYGTTDFVTSGDNTFGKEENWEEIANGNLNMPEERNASITVPTVSEKAYRAYKLIFNTVKDVTTAEFVHIDELQFIGTLAEERLGDDLLNPGDPSIGFFIDRYSSTSSYPEKEGPHMLFDNDKGTKYLNRSPIKCGAIFTLDEAAAIRSLYFTTANDDASRDPLGFILYGTNEEIVSGDNSDGMQENWTEVAGGSLAFPADRQVNTDLIAISNDTAYKSYKIIFTKTSNASLFQVADMYIFSDAEGTQVIPTSVNTPALAVQCSALSDTVVVTDDESAQHAVDGDTSSKYVNRAKIDCGMILDPAHPKTIVKAMQITTGNDEPSRDPVEYQLFGTNDSITSAEYSDGNSENWELISEGALDLPEARTSKVTIAIDNNKAYSHYKFYVKSIRDITYSQATCFQVAEFQLVGEIVEKAPENFLTPNDFIIAIDSDMSHTDSSYPEAESPAMILDGDPETKYLNRAGTFDSGFIVTPACGASVVTAIQAVTANDAPARDPMTYELYGTNDEIVTEDNGDGLSENWILISSGELGMPEARFAAGDYLWFENATSYKSYKMIFPTLRDGAGQVLMQVADIYLYDANGEQILSTDDAILAIASKYVPESSYPVNENPTLLIDGNILTKYLNKGRNNSGVILTPSIGATTVTGFTITTANDFANRDPMTYELYGTNDEIVTEDNGLGIAENWTLIIGGETGMATPRRRSYTFMFANDVEYTSYKLVFPTIRNFDAVDATQIAELKMYEGTAPTPEEDPELSYTYENGELVLTFVGGLESSTDGINWVAVDATSPYTVALTGAKMFFRASVNANNGGIIVGRADQGKTIIDPWDLALPRGGETEELASPQSSAVI